MCNLKKCILINLWVVSCQEGHFNFARKNAWTLVSTDFMYCSLHSAFRLLCTAVIRTQVLTSTSNRDVSSQA